MKSFSPKDSCCEIPEPIRLHWTRPQLHLSCFGLHKEHLKGKFDWKQGSNLCIEFSQAFKTQHIAYLGENTEDAESGAWPCRGVGAGEANNALSIAESVSSSSNIFRLPPCGLFSSDSLFTCTSETGSFFTLTRLTPMSNLGQTKYIRTDWRKNILKNIIAYFPLLPNPKSAPPIRMSSTLSFVKVRALGWAACVKLSDRRPLEALAALSARNDSSSLKEKSRCESRKTLKTRGHDLDTYLTVRHQISDSGSRCFAGPKIGGHPIWLPSRQQTIENLRRSQRLWKQ